MHDFLSQKKIKMSEDFSWYLGGNEALKTRLKSSPSLPAIGGSPLKEPVMTSHERKICSLVSCGAQSFADRRAFWVPADTDVSESKVAPYKRKRTYAAS